MAAGIVTAALAGTLLFLLLRRRRRGREEEPGETVPQEPPPEPAGMSGSRRPDATSPLWGDGPSPPPPATREPLGRLFVIGGPLTGETFQVGDAPASIGTGHRCVVRLPETSGGEELVPEQARVWVRGGQLMLHELRRLTAIGAEGGSWSILAPGDMFTIGPCTFRFELAGEEAAGPAGAPERSQEVPNVLRVSDDRSGEEGAAPAATPGDRQDGVSASPPPPRPQPEG